MEGDRVMGVDFPLTVLVIEFSLDLLVYKSVTVSPATPGGDVKVCLLFLCLPPQL